MYLVERSFSERPQLDASEPAGAPLGFGLRLALWYATLFVTGALAIVFLTYYLTSISLAQRDREVIQSKLGEYGAVYERGGLRALADTVSAEQRTAPERLFVRVVDRGSEALVLGMSEGWEAAKLETGSLRLADGTLVQVGKSTEAREDLLGRFRAVLGLVAFSIVVIALSGGWIATQSALQPIRRLTAAVNRIVRTGQTERVPVAGHDDAITELTRLFNAMLDRIERLVAGMRGALDNVSHDLRTPLTRLRGSAEMALRSEPDLDRYREALADCVEESDRVLVMLNTLMDISEAESGAMQLRRESVDLAEVAGRTVDLYREVAESKGVALTLETSGPAVVWADGVRIEQVAANLIDNAVKYTPSGGQVWVQVGSGAGVGVLTVHDTGAGIPLEELPHIWDRLFRGDRSRAARGLGLGLSLVKAIVEAHGGTVRAESQSGNGSTFVVTLPVSRTV
jgi:signal transduction histidine kinase